MSEWRLAVVVAVWSVKGGVGVTSVAAVLALAQVEQAEEVLLIDLCGDIATLLGVDDRVLGPGLAEWCALGRPDAQALARVEIEARPGLRFVPRGTGELVADPVHLLEVVRSSRRTVILDCGLVGQAENLGRGVAVAASTSLLVVRECFLNLRAAQNSDLQPTGVVVIKEPGRHLGRADVEAVTGAPVFAEIACDSSIARSLDAGLVRSRLPRSLLRSMARVVRHAA